MIQPLLFLLFLVIVGIAVWYPRFRLAMGILCGGIVIGIGFVIWLDTQERGLEFHRVSIAEVQLSHMKIRPGLNSRSFVVNGRLQNNSQRYAITSATLQVTLEDCHGINNSECELIGQERAELSLEIPGGQARDFQKTIPFSTVPKIQGEATWHYEIVQVRAH
ncbi:MAG: hypothetical protein AB7P17_05710 [Nitrospirales bacterium]|nr:hypothetical protein [Nitrospirales bacterium]